MKEKCVEFFNKDKITLRGILHLPDGNDKKTGVIILNTGLNDMVGWHRIQVEMARNLASNGYTVLRYDNPGIGDSDGELKEKDVPQLLTQIEQGLWVDDTFSALDYMSKEFHLNNIFLLGFCGGAINSIHSASKKQTNITGIINIAAPFTLSKALEEEKLNPYNVNKRFSYFSSKIFRWKSVKSFLTGKSDYKDIFNTVKAYIRLKILGTEKIVEDIAATDSNNHNSSINKKLIQSLEKLIKTDIPALFYYPEFDAATWEIENIIFKKYGDAPYFKNHAKYIKLSGANHIFADIDSQEQLLADVFDWLEETTKGN